MMRRRAFTYIELTIVAVIVAVLAAIAVPNFLEAVVRARVSANRARLVVLQNAIENYRVDHRHYPLNARPRSPAESDLACLTTPVSYLTALPYTDVHPTPWTSAAPVRELPAYLNLEQVYGHEDPYRLSPEAYGTGRTALTALNLAGPDGAVDMNLVPEPVTFREYDPTNGTISPGDLNLFAP